jgi:cytolysin (calcineurin-like family phosphatase)
VTQNSRVDAARVFISSTDLSYWGPKNRNVYLFSNVTYFTVSSKWWNPAA